MERRGLGRSRRIRRGWELVFSRHLKLRDRGVGALCMIREVLYFFWLARKSMLMEYGLLVSYSLPPLSSKELT